MKLAIDCRMSGHSGIGTFIDGLLPYFITNTNFDFLLIGNKELQAVYGHNKNVDFEVCNEKPFSAKELLFFPKDLSNKINSCNAFFSPYCNIPSGIKIPIFTTIHDIIFLDVKGLTGYLGTFLRKEYYKYAIKKSISLFTVSNFSKERIIDRLSCKKTINIVYNGLPAYLENETANENATKKDSFILFIGNIKKHKGLPVLLQAFSKFSLEQEAKLVIVGDKENFRTKDSEIEKLIDTNDKNIVFTGRISNEKLHSLLKQAKLLVQPSFYEGFGIPPLEALKCGTNVILSDIPVFKEIYSNLPVHFFFAGDSENLKEKIKEVWNTELKNVIIPKQYSYKFSAAKILNDIVTIISK